VLRLQTRHCWRTRLTMQALDFADSSPSEASHIAGMPLQARVQWAQHLLCDVGRSHIAGSQPHRSEPFWARVEREEMSGKSGIPGLRGREQ
jgi:hypothetical protein